MNLGLVVALLLGIAGIILGGINRQIASELGLAHMATMSLFFTFSFCAFFFLLVVVKPDLFPESFKYQVHWSSFQWWYLIPPLLNLFIVIGFPYALSKIGAVQITVGLIAAQMFTSVCWDIWIEKLPLTNMKIIGMVFALISAVCISLSN